MRTISIGGMGGFELGIQAALTDVAAQPGTVALQPVAFCEAERRAKEVLRRHWPGAVTYNDVWDIINNGTIERRSVDIICGKFRSGDVVVAGAHQRVVPAAGRHQAAVRLMRHVQPRWAIFEFECDVLRRDGGRRFQALLAHATGWVPTIPHGGWRSFGVATPAPGLGDDAYGVAWRVLDLRYFGIPGDTYTMERERLYVVGCRGSAAALTEVLLDGADVDGLPKPVGAATDAWMGEPNIIPFDGRCGKMNASPIEPRRYLPTIHGQNVALAIGAPVKMVRWLTPLECECAFTLPDDYTAMGQRVTEKKNALVAIKDAPRYRMIGRHTVPPAIVEWIFSRILKNEG